MEEKAFEQLKADIKDASFSSDKITLLKAASQTLTFTCQQVVDVLDQFSFSSDKVKGLKELTGSITDPKNKQLIIKALNDSKAENLLKDIKPAMPICPYALTVPNKAIRSPDEMKELLGKIGDENFSSGKIDVLKDEIKSNSTDGFTAEQVINILALFAHSSDKVEVIKLIDDLILGLTCEDVNKVIEAFSFSSDKLTVLAEIKKTILDGQNKYKIVKEFTFGSDKTKAEEILRDVDVKIPPRSPVYGTIKHKNVVFVFDCSGSMSVTFTTSQKVRSSRLAFCIKELQNVINGQLINDYSHFSVIAFSSGVQALFNKLEVADDDNKKKACNSVACYRAGGGTNSLGALTKALSFKDVEAIYFLSDGEPNGNASSIVKTITEANKNNVVINTIAFLLPQTLPKAAEFMKSLAEQNSGVFRCIE